MDNRGFTLVELLVVMVIIGIITAMSFPIIRNINESNTNKKFDTYNNSLVSAAKLYNDSYNKDLFGDNYSGCAYIKYSELKDKGLVKDINVDNITCESDNTFVKITKVDNKYKYSAYMGCRDKDSSNINIIYPSRNSKTPYTVSNDCNGSTDNEIQLTSSANDKNTKFSFTITSNTSINRNSQVYYAWSTSSEPSSITSWKLVDFNILSYSEQDKKIINNGTIVINSSLIDNPSKVKGSVYLFAKSDNLMDKTGKLWVGDNGTNIKRYGPYQVDGSNTIYLDANGGSVNPSSMSVYKGDKYNLPNPSRSNATFNGWYTSKSGGTKINNGDKINLKNNVTYYARWSINKYNLRVDTSHVSSFDLKIVSSDGTTTYNKSGLTSYNDSSEFGSTYYFSNVKYNTNYVYKSYNINNGISVSTDNGSTFSFNHSLGSDLTFTISSIFKCNSYSINYTFDYDYTGGVQSFSPSCPGKYKLEVWGAEGGTAYTTGYTGAGGLGGYSSGNVSLDDNDTLYIVVGGRGKDSNRGKVEIYSGGYNGGGNGYTSRTTTGTSASSGGGATHIATKSGTLSSLRSYKDRILIVAGGGGGSHVDTDKYGYNSAGGAGGGTTGGGAIQQDECGHTCVRYNGYPSGGTQTSGGQGVPDWTVATFSSSQYVGSFGAGATGTSAYGGGGGGYYGGASGKYNGGGGGSGYVSSSLSSSSTSQSSHSGDGYARITYLGD